MSGNFPENKEFYRAGALGQIHYMSVRSAKILLYLCDFFSNGSMGNFFGTLSNKEGK